MSSSSYSHFFSTIFQHICVSLDVNFNKLLTNDVVSFGQLGPEVASLMPWFFLKRIYTFVGTKNLFSLP